MTNESTNTVAPGLVAKFQLLSTTKLSHRSSKSILITTTLHDIMDHMVISSILRYQSTQTTERNPREAHPNGDRKFLTAVDNLHFIQPSANVPAST